MKMMKTTIGSHDVDSQDDEQKKTQKRGEIGLCLSLFFAPRSLSTVTYILTCKLRHSS